MSGKKLILVVDDEAKILEVVSAYLEKKGIRLWQWMVDMRHFC